MGPARFHCATLLSVPTSVKNQYQKQNREPETSKIIFVRSGIRTHAHRSGLRPERSALDHSAILTSWAI